MALQPNMVMTTTAPIHCWINGKSDNTVSALDRGLHYGDGLFETMAVKDGRILLEDYHLERLAEGCKRLMLPLPAQETLRHELKTLAGTQRQLVLKLILTRGEGGRGYLPPRQNNPTRILIAYPWPEYPASWYEKGIHVHICDTHLGHNARLAGLKHLSRTEQVLARSEWGERDDIQEGLMVDEEGAVIEGTMTNIFAWLPHGVLATPSLRLAGVEGVVRRYILERARQARIQVRVATLSLSELMGASEIFVCNSVIGVWPVALIGHWKYSIGSMTRRIQGWVAER